jgi:L-rhamnose mutarotase
MAGIPDIRGSQLAVRGSRGARSEKREAMLRKAFRMSVHPGHEAEYARRHHPVWKELEETLFRHGVHTYSIFLDADRNDLFAYVECESEERWAAIAATEVCQRWWHHMRELMPSNADNSPVSAELPEVFHIERK